ncbi:MAG: cytochrome c oxidase accessory protein CcoG [Kofleriaceae bacterium]
MSAPAPSSPSQRAPAAEPTTPARRALPTLNRDGTRFLVRPKLSRGRFLNRRRVIGYALIALFVLLPQLRVGGRPPMLIDLVHREIVFLGTVFRPSEGFLLMLLGLAVVLTVFFVTAMWGRVWCGYACPQTVYLELIFRPIERWLEGTPAQQRALDAKGANGRRRLKWLIYLVLAFVIANVFLSYFVPTDLLYRWVLGSPTNHPGGFAVVCAVTALMFFDFAYFREQTCTVACPYGRLQSVLLDRRSLIVGYDARRGEPRGKVGKASQRDAADAPARGDCIDCGACVATCPTGIDIRDGLQMECIGCAQCIDACDPIMDKLKRPRGLIRYASQEQLAGEPRKLSRLRVWLYPGLLAVVGSVSIWLLGARASSELWVLRNDAAAFQTLDDGQVSSLVRLKIENRDDRAHAYVVSLADDPESKLISSRPQLRLAGGSAEVLSLFVIGPQRAFTGGKRGSVLVVQEDGRELRRLPVTLLGPDHAPVDHRDDGAHDDGAHDEGAHDEGARGEEAHDDGAHGEETHGEGAHDGDRAEGQEAAP